MNTGGNKRRNRSGETVVTKALISTAGNTVHYAEMDREDDCGNIASHPNR